jgi:arylsulfatase A-like enzyme
MHTRLSIALLLLGCGGACSPPASPAPRLVVLYATCTLNKDYLSPYNATVDYTPHLASLARDGRVFMKHHTESGISGVAYAALLSGQHATRHGVFTHPRRLSDAVYLVTEAFADAGYETFFWADHPMATPEFNYGQGVPASNLFWTKRRRRKPAQERFLKATDPRLARILERLMSDPTYRAFLLTNFTVTHGPYRPDHLATFCSQYPEECESVTADDAERYAALFRQHYVGWVVAYEETRESLGLSADDTAQLVRVVELLYKANVHYLDTQLGALIERIDAAGLLDQSLIAFTADHGEVLYRENAPFKWTHGGTLAPEVLEVPLIVRGGGVQPGLYDRVTRSVDVFPTLAGLAEIEPSHGRRSLREPARRGAAPRADRLHAHRDSTEPRARRAVPGRRDDVARGPQA